MRHSTLLLLLPLLFCFGSCAKKEQAVTLPARNSNIHATVEMGADYKTQIFYNLGDSSIVSTSDHSMWDVAFEAGAGQSHLFLNGCLGLSLLRVADTSFAAVCSLPAGTNSKSWLNDASNGVPDSSAAGSWQTGTTNYSNLYILRFGGVPPYQYKKLRILAVDDKQYTIEYGTLSETQCHVTTLPKDEGQNFIYYKFATGIVTPDPPKAQWDIQFTRYETAIFDDSVGVEGLVPYPVNGVLLNPYHTSAAVITTNNFDGVTAAAADSVTFSAYRDVIGYDWKTYTATGTYTINSALCYLIRTQSGQLWKLHFVGWYDKQGVGGSPSFEFLRLQ